MGVDFGSHVDTPTPRGVGRARWKRVHRVVRPCCRSACGLSDSPGAGRLGSHRTLRHALSLVFCVVMGRARRHGCARTARAVTARTAITRGGGARGDPPSRLRRPSEHSRAVGERAPSTRCAARHATLPHTSWSPARDRPAGATAASRRPVDAMQKQGDTLMIVGSRSDERESIHARAARRGSNPTRQDWRAEACALQRRERQVSGRTTRSVKLKIQSDPLVARRLPQICRAKTGPPTRETAIHSAPRRVPRHDRIGELRLVEHSGSELVHVVSKIIVQVSTGAFFRHAASSGRSRFVAAENRSPQI